MLVEARISSGIKAIDAVVRAGGRDVHAIVTREALEARWVIGPTQEDLWAAFHAHQAEIEREIVRLAAARQKNIVVLYEMRAPMVVRHPEIEPTLRKVETRHGT